MDNQSIIEQGIDICVKQIDYIEFGLKQSENTSYLITSVSILNTLLTKHYPINHIDKQYMISLLYKIGINPK